MHTRSDPTSHDRTRPTTEAQEKRRRERQGGRLLSEFLRGTLWSGAAYLFGSCSLVFGAAPLGISLLSASSTHTWYIAAGLLLSAITRPVTLSCWGWAGVYVFCLVLRLCIRFFVDPPTLPDGRPCRGRTYLFLCWVSFKRNIGLGATDKPDGHGEDYYAGHGAPHAARPDVPPMGARAPEMHLFAEHPFLRMLTAAVGGFAAGLFGVLTGGFHVYDLLGLLFLVAACPLATFMLVSCFSEAGRILLFSKVPLSDMPLRKKGLRGKELSDRDGGMSRVMARFDILPLLSVAFLLGAVVFAARGLRLSPGVPYLVLESATLLGLLFTLFASARLGVVPGVAVGVICGLAAEPRLSPVFILAAGGYALLRYISPRAGVFGGCSVGAVWCALVEGMLTLVTQFPALLLTMPLYFLCEKLPLSIPEVGRRTEADRELEAFTAAVTDALTAEISAESRRARMAALSDAFGALSKRLYSLSGQLRRPRLPDLRRLCDESFGKQCARCRHRDACWGADYDRTVDMQIRLSSRLYTEGRVGMDALTEDQREVCPHMDRILEDINTRAARLCEALSRNEKTDIFAADYAAISTLFGDALEEERLETEAMAANRRVADLIYDYLTDEGIGVQGVVVAGKPSSGRGRVILQGIGLDALEGPGQAARLRARMEDICGTRFSPPVSEAGRAAGSRILTFDPAVSLRAAYAGSTVPAGTDPQDILPPPLTHKTPANGYCPPAVCGDHIALFKSENAYFYALISDGMGSGEDASLTSDICAMFLEKMLSAGNRVEVSLKMLDGYIHAKNTGTGDECSATVDLMELDLMDGHAVFAKSGAAPTYVVRDGVVYKLRSRTMPIGILRDLPPEYLRFRMHPGDVVVMVSDGVTRGQDECPWLIDLLSSPMPESMDTLRHDIIRRALASGSEDDLSAIAIRVEEAG